MTKAYSYVRFSKPIQKEGDSLDRQMAYAKKYAEEHNLILDDSLSMRDEGLSAYHQMHIRKGAFGVFLSAIESGKVQRGSILIIEALDRISRAEPLEAQAILSQIIMAGITVVTAIDGKVYEREAIKKNPMDLVYSLLIFVRANEESETKSKRLKEFLLRQIKKWQDTGKGTVLPFGDNPSWCKQNSDRSGFDVVEDRFIIVQEIISLYMSGWGLQKIVNKLNEQHKSFRGKKWSLKTVNNILKNRSLIGDRWIYVDGKEYKINNYYPPVLSDDEFYNLQKTINSRARTLGQKKIVSLLTGMDLTYCGYCCRTFEIQNYVNKGKYKHENDMSKLPNGYRRIRCKAARIKATCPNSKSRSVVPIEYAILEYCSDAMDLSSILGDNNKTASLRSKISSLSIENDQKTTQIKNGEQAILNCLVSDVDATHLVGMVNKLKDEQKALQARIDDLDRELHYHSRHQERDVVTEWQTIKEKSKSMDEDTRLMVRQLIKRTFKRIDIFLHGMDLSDNEFLKRIKPVDDFMQPYPDTIDVILTFHNEKQIILSIDKKTGQWIKGEKDVTREGLEQKRYTL